MKNIEKLYNFIPGGAFFRLRHYACGIIILANCLTLLVAAIFLKNFLILCTACAMWGLSLCTPQNNNHNEACIHYQSDAACEFLEQYLKQIKVSGKSIRVLCIGTTACAGDTFGPAVGQLLRQWRHDRVFGTLTKPVDALNLKEHVAMIDEGEFLIVVDSSVGRDSAREGLLTVKKGSIQPGKFLNKKLPRLGNVAITFNAVAFNGHVNPWNVLKRRESKDRCLNAAQIAATALHNWLDSLSQEGSNYNSNRQA